MVGGLLMGFAGGVLSLSIIQTWTEGLTGGRGWIALGLVTFASWHPLLAVLGTLLFGGFEAAQFRLPASAKLWVWIFVASNRLEAISAIARRLALRPSPRMP